MTEKHTQAYAEGVHPTNTKNKNRWELKAAPWAVPERLVKARLRPLVRTNLNWNFTPTKLVIPQTSAAMVTINLPICWQRCDNTHMNESVDVKARLQ